jgi:hypothetical protein
MVFFLSIADLFEMTQFQLKEIGLDEQMRPVLSQIIHNFEVTNLALEQVITEIVVEPISLDSVLYIRKVEAFGCGIYAPWEWKWFGINKNRNKYRAAFLRSEMNYPGPIPVDDKNIPDDLILCGVEAMVATLLFLIPTGYTQAAALILVGDIVFRLGDGLKELSARNREAQEIMSQSNTNLEFKQYRE